VSLSTLNTHNITLENLTYQRVTFNIPCEILGEGLSLRRWSWGRFTKFGVLTP